MAQMELGFKDREIGLAAREHAAGSVNKELADDSDDDLAVIFSSGSISGPDADGILDLANIRGLEPKLYNPRHQIGTLMSLYETTVARSPSLQKTLASVNSGYAVEWILDRFSREFISLVRIRQQSTLDVIRVIALSQMSDASVIYSKLQELSVSAELTGTIPVLSSTHCLKSVQELPGIVELTNSDSARRLIHWAEIGKFIKNIVWFDNDRKGKLMKARATLSESDGTAYSDHDLLSLNSRDSSTFVLAGSRDL